MASNSNSERTNVITMLCYKLDRFTQPCISTPHGRGAHWRVYSAPAVIMSLMTTAEVVAKATMKRSDA